MNPVRVLGLCGLCSAVLSAIGGFANLPAIVGVAGLVMIAGNLFALFHRAR